MFPARTEGWASGVHPEHRLLRAGSGHRQISKHVDSAAGDDPADMFLLMYQAQASHEHDTSTKKLFVSHPGNEELHCCFGKTVP